MSDQIYPQDHQEVHWSNTVFGRNYRMKDTCLLVGDRSGVEAAARNLELEKYPLDWWESPLLTSYARLSGYERNLSLATCAVFFEPHRDHFTRQLVKTCLIYKKPYWIVRKGVEPERLGSQLEEHFKGRVMRRVFVTGPMEENCPGLEAWAEVFLRRVFEGLR